MKTHIYFSSLTVDKVTESTKNCEVENLLKNNDKLSNQVGGKRRVARGLKQAKAQQEGISHDTQDFALGFSLLGPYMKELKRNNPESIIKIEHTETNTFPAQKVFKRLFVQLDPMVTATLNAQKITAYDAGFLKTYFWGRFQIIFSGTIDGENRKVMTSFSIVPVENSENYTWHMKNQKENASLALWFEEEGFSCVSDRDKGLKKMLMDCCPLWAMHACGRHVMGNCPQSSSMNKGLYWACVKADKKSKFQSNFEAFGKEHPIQHAYLKQIPVELWTKAYFLGDVFFATSNIVEQLMALYLAEREMEPVALIKNILLKEMKTHDKYRLDDRERVSKKHKISSYAQVAFEEQCTLALAYIALATGGTPVDGMVSFIVRFKTVASTTGASDDGATVLLKADTYSTQLCSTCRIRICPCRHIIAAMYLLLASLGGAEASSSRLQASTSFNNIVYRNVENWFVKAVLMTTLTAAYNGGTSFNPCIEEIDVDEDDIILPPFNAYKKTRGVFAMKRIASRYQVSFGDKSGASVRYCGNCLDTDHTVTSCLSIQYAL